MFGYKEFHQDGIQVFQQFCKEYGYKLVNSNCCKLIFESTMCKIVLAIEGTVLNGYFMEPETEFIDNKWYTIGHVLKYFKCPQEYHYNLGKAGLRKRITSELKQLEMLIRRYCLVVVRDGDFSWRNEFLEYQKNLNSWMFDK